MGRQSSSIKVGAFVFGLQREINLVESHLTQSDALEIDISNRG